MGFGVCLEKMKKNIFIKKKKLVNSPNITLKYEIWWTSEYFM